MRRLRPTRTHLILVLSLLSCGAVFAGAALTASHQRHPVAVPGGAPAAPAGAPSRTARIAGPDTRIRLVGHGVSPRVSSLAVTHPYTGPVRAAPARESEHQPAPAAPSRRDGALQTHTIGATPGLGASFEGLANSDNAAVNNGIVNIPPDTVGDVGPSNYVEAVNAPVRSTARLGRRSSRGSRSRTCGRRRAGSARRTTTAIRSCCTTTSRTVG
jgi:hypothetical protein